MSIISKITSQFIVMLFNGQNVSIIKAHKSDNRYLNKENNKPDIANGYDSDIDDDEDDIGDM